MHAAPGQALIETGAVVIGAGPVGLFQVFELGLLDIQAHVVDALPFAGGQPVELYADKPIYDIPAVPVCTGRELADALLTQVRPFAPTFHLDQTVTSLQRQDDGRWLLATRTGTRFLTRTVFIAAGVGAFEPRRLKLEGLDAFEGSQLFFRLPDPAAFSGERVVIVGDGDAALDAALALAEGPQRAASVTLMHRRDAFQADPARVERMRALCAAGAMRFVVAQATGLEADGGRLQALQVTGPDAVVQSLPLDRLLVCQGVSPRLGPVTEWGLDLERKLVKVDTATFATSAPGIFAVGDVVTYPGKKKLIASGFHECVMAAFGAAAYLTPGHEQRPLEYTTSSSRLHRLLGVDGQDAPGGAGPA
ncbi:NAD(P)/FAD-dependent oxidoreductase [Ramlibacter sp. MAHUQ-53]|uniref:NAD(P)/FAD-dependent oxidoreductase n=1 Tax=unclassified Ramlibacter TaxID=2617605 RepID=UPI00362DE90F